ncbi:MAG: hypothetical protein KKH98_02895, partial [Spirochaetes bacterium]|nr:hypothetical protein [Spirochaetota bacterium]
MKMIIKKNLFIIFMSVLTSFLLIVNTTNRSSAEISRLSNEFIKLTGSSDNGSFVIRTTGGFPGLKTDNNKLLLFEDEIPTSFSTIRINERNYKFGSEEGEFIGNMITGDQRMKCAWMKKKIKVIQYLRFVQGITTGNIDTIEISYDIENTDTQQHDIGIRIMLDTYLGKEDGAPFRIPGRGPVTTELFLSKSMIPSYWYAFDDLMNSTIRAQGTLLKRNTLKPDKVVYASWIKFSENLWDFSLEEGKSFRRTPLGPLDSAVAVYWYPRRINPKESFQVKTYYGIYGADVHSGISLSASLCGPLISYMDPFLVTLDIKNIAKDDLESVSAGIILPGGLELAEDEKKVKLLDRLDSGQIRHLNWKVVPDSFEEGEFEYQVKIKAGHRDKKDTITMKRKIKLVKIREQIVEELEENDLKVNETETGWMIEFGDVYFKYNRAELTHSAKEKLQVLG